MKQKTNRLRGQTNVCIYDDAWIPVMKKNNRGIYRVKSSSFKPAWIEFAISLEEPIIPIEFSPMEE